MSAKKDMKGLTVSRAVLTTVRQAAPQQEYVTLVMRVIQAVIAQLWIAMSTIVAKDAHCPMYATHVMLVSLGAIANLSSPVTSIIAKLAVRLMMFARNVIPGTPQVTALRLSAGRWCRTAQKGVQLTLKSVISVMQGCMAPNVTLTITRFRNARQILCKR